jgi:hypothetical protein
MFVSHETYTPARGGSAAAEITALRQVFGPTADEIVITNTKGFTGHAMGAGIEDVVAVKALETGIVPPVPNYKEPDPELGRLNLSVGGAYPVSYALRLAAGFGSQIAMALLRWTPMPDGRRRSVSQLGYASRIVDPAAWQPGSNASPAGRAPRSRSCTTLRVVDTGPAAAPAHCGPAAPAAAAQRQPPSSPDATTRPRGTCPGDARSPAAGARTGGRARLCLSLRQRATRWATRWSSIVAEMTGYPPELLDVDLDLEADLGVDTVKQAEVFAAVREGSASNATPTCSCATSPPSPTSSAGSATRPASSPPPPRRRPPPQPPPRPPRLPPRRPDEVADAVVSIVAEMTGYPPELLDLSTSTSRPTSASTPSSRPRCSPRSANGSASNATPTSSCATSPPSPTSSAGSATRPASSPPPPPPQPGPPPPVNRPRGRPRGRPGGR